MRVTVGTKTFFVSEPTLAACQWAIRVLTARAA